MAESLPDLHGNPLEGLAELVPVNKKRAEDIVTGEQG